MPRVFHPPQHTGKQPPAVLPRKLARLVDLGDGTAWPICLVTAPGAGLQCVTLTTCYGVQAANRGQLEAVLA